MQETQETSVRSLGQEDPLEKGMVTHSGVLTWISPWREGPGGLLSRGLQRVRHDWATKHARTLNFLQIWTKLKGTYPSLKHTEYFHCPKSCLCSIYSSLPTPTLATTDLFIIFTALPCPEFFIVGFIPYTTFSNWLLSLSNVHWRFLHIFSWLDSWLIFSAE